jgi:hypothetical protein
MTAPRFEIESKCVREASEDQFAKYKAWLRDSETFKFYTFTGPTRDDVKAQAVAMARKIRPPRSEEYSFVCGRHQVGALHS